MNRIQANLVLLLAGAIWGMGFVAQSSAMEAITPFVFIGLRFVIASLTILPLTIWEARRATTRLQRRDYLAFVWIGLMLFCAMAPQQFGLLTTTVTNSGFLTGLYVVMTPIFVVLLFRQFPHPVIWPATLLALAGIFLLSGGALGGLSQGDWLTIFGAGFSALQVIFISRNAGRTGRPIALSNMQFAVAGLIGLACAVQFERFELAGIMQALPEILFAGAISGGIAFTLQVVGQRYTTASQAAIFLSSEAVFAAIFGAALLGERIAAIALSGCVLIFCAMLMVELLPGLMQRKKLQISSPTL